MGDEVNITYETLFELLRREKNREELQKLDDSFFDDVLAYLKEEKEALKQLKTKHDLFAAEQFKRAEIQEENIRKILRELYEKREKKIINMALDKSRTVSSIIDVSALLKQELELYEYLSGLLDRFRKGILYKLLEAEPLQTGPAVVYQPSHNAPLEMEPEINPEIEKEVNTVLGGLSEDPKPGEKRVKFIEQIPQFVGTDLSEYGPFEAEETSELPLNIAEFLIEKGKAKEA